MKKKDLKEIIFDCFIIKNDRVQFDTDALLSQKQRDIIKKIINQEGNKYEY